ncbi:hypothetical protein TNCV_430101 [Trichonephila clavipes]|nr:hypothetical protein TNCV_430101 [Trichonephila clavipes]
MAAVDFLHNENPPTWARVEPATLRAEGQRQTNHATQPEFLMFDFVLSHTLKATRGLLVTNCVISNSRQMTKTTSKLVPSLQLITQGLPASKNLTYIISTQGFFLGTRARIHDKTTPAMNSRPGPLGYRGLLVLGAMSN